MTHDEYMSATDNLIEETIRNFERETKQELGPFMKQKLRLELWQLLTEQNKVVFAYVRQPYDEERV